MSQTLVNRNRARGRIRETVRRQGERLKGAKATAVIASLVAAACMAGLPENPALSQNLSG